MNYSHLLPELQNYVRSYFSLHSDARLYYHNIQHTEMVAEAASRIANHYQLEETEYFIVLVAAWFHDTGYFTQPATHEQHSAALAAQFLAGKGAEEEVIQKVKQCIAATKMPQSPENLLEQIVCDADLFHLGTAVFPEVNKSLHKESEELKGHKISKTDWRNNTIRLLEQHHYHTDYARLLLNDGKAAHLQKLKNKAIEKESEAAGVNNGKAGVTEQLKVATAETKKDKSRPDRGIETMFRITSNNNQRLSDMADNKAHIMITVNSIILSAIISLLLGKLVKQGGEHLALPTYLILAVSVMAIIFSILATRPSLPKGKFTKEDIAEKKVNLLFFGNFYKMNLQDYTEGMLEVMKDRDFLYGSLIRDVYSQGIVLGRKYRLLRISYNIFMFGLVASVLAFVIATAIHER